MSKFTASKLTPGNCVVCHNPIAPDSTFVGAGDGKGQAFAHRRCWKIVNYARHYGSTRTLAEIVKQGMKE